jgi:hypothetical protein
MRRVFLSVGTFCFAFALCLDWPATVAAQQPDPETKAKFEAIQKQITDLQKKIDKQIADLQAKIEALHQQEQALLEAKDHFSKIHAEVKGRLKRIPDTSGMNAKQEWTVTAQGMTWYLDFAGKKEWLDLAKKMENKTVLVAGPVVQSSRGYTTNFFPSPSFPGPGGWSGTTAKPNMPGGFSPGLGGFGGPGLGTPLGYPYGIYTTVTTFTMTVEKFVAP